MRPCSSSGSHVRHSTPRPLWQGCCWGCALQQLDAQLSARQQMLVASLLCISLLCMGAENKPCPASLGGHGVHCRF
jgi:hypothetical protein